MGSPILRNCNRFSLCSPADSQTLTYSQSAHPQTHKLSQIRSVLTHRLTISHRFPVCSPTDSQTITDSQCAHPHTHKLSHIPSVLTHRLTHIPSVLSDRHTISHRSPVCSPTDSQSLTDSQCAHPKLTNSHRFPVCSPTHSQTLTHSHCAHPPPSTHQ